MNDTPSLDRVLATERPYLVRYARRRLDDVALVEDVVQETLLAALQGYGRFEGKATLRTWLTGILINKIADAVRREHRAGAALYGRPAAGDGDADADADADRDGDAPGRDSDAGGAARGEPIDWLDPARLLEGRQFVELLMRRLDALPPRAARAFTLREIEGRSLDEIAAALGTSAGHSAVLLHRARQRLRDGLQRHFGGTAADQLAAA